MKSILAISLFVGVALCNSISFHAWIPQKEFTYKFESEVLTGIPQIDSQYSGLKLASNVKVQSFDDYSLRIKFEQPRYIVVNQKLQIHEGRPLVPKPETELPEQLRMHLEKPFSVHLKRGVVEEFFVERDEPVVITNLKKALLSQLQLDLTASRRDEVPLNNGVQKQQQEQQESGLRGEIASHFSTFESTVLGDCETHYTVNELPAFQAKEVEERIRVTEQQLQQEGIIEGQKSNGEKICQNKKYFEVVKTKNFDECKNIPAYQSASGIKLKCDFTKAKCNDALTHISSTRYIICGSSLEDFYIRESLTENSILTNPLGWFSSEERMSSKSRVTLTLLNVESSGYSPLPRPNSPKSERSLVFQYPKHSIWSSDSGTRSLRPEQETNAFGLNAVLRQPDLTSRSDLYTSPLPMNELKQKITEQLKMVVREIYQSPESCSSRADVAGTISSISYYLRPLSLEELKEIERGLYSSSSLDQPEKEIMHELWLDVVSMIGTNPATMLIKTKVEEQRDSLSTVTMVRIIQNTMRNAKTPTTELLSKLLDMVKSIKNRLERKNGFNKQEHVYNVALVQYSNLIYKACIDTSMQTSNFPVRIFGLFCRQNSRVVTEEYIPYLISQLKEARQESDKLIIISALGKVGHYDTLEPLVQMIEERSQLSSMGRSVAVYMLKRLAKNQPTLVKPILMSLIDNPAETTEVRIAAVSVLPWTQPSVSELQKIAVRSWFEPSKQVASFIYSTLYNIVDTEIPELKSVGEKSRGLLRLVKPFQYGIQFSKNTHSKKFIEYLRAASNVESSYVNTEKSYTPSKLSISSRLFGGSWEIEGLTFGMYSKGMDQFVDSLIEKLGNKSEISQHVKQQLEQIMERLRIKQRPTETPASLLYFGMVGYDRIYSLDKHFYDQLIEKISEQVRESTLRFDDVNRKFNYTHARYVIDLEVFGPTDSGFILHTSRNIPIVAGFKGQVEAEGRSSRQSQVQLKLIPVLNAKMQSNMGVISPFTKEIIGAGIEASVHVSLPLKLKSKMSANKIDLTLESPEEIQNQFEVFHAFIKPFTVRKSLEEIQPMSKSKNAKPILSMSKPEKHVKQIGESLGLQGQLTIETDFQTPYFGSLWNTLKQHNFVSLMSMFYPSSVKYASYKVEFNPKASSTKKIEAVLSTVHGQKGEDSQIEVYSPTLEETKSENEQQISQMCEENYQETREDIQECKEHLKKRINHKKEIYERLQVVLQQQGEQTQVRGLLMEASLKSQSSRKTINSAVLFSAKKEGEFWKIIGELTTSAPSLPKYNAKLELDIQMPKIKTRWNIESILNEPIELRNKLLLTYGEMNKEQKEISLETNLFKTENQMNSLRNSQEMEKCKEELRNDHTLASVCEEVRHQASSVNKVELIGQMPLEVRNSWILQKVKYALERELFPLISLDKVEVQDTESDSYKLTAEINRQGSVAQVWINSPSMKVELKNVTIPQPVKGLFPLSVRNGISTRLVQDVTRDQAPASCRFDSFVTTFDNVTYVYPMNECPHLLFKDCSSSHLKKPIAVLARKTSGDQKEVKILSNLFEIKLEPKGQQSGVIVKVDGQEIDVSTDKPYTRKSDVSGQILLKIYRTLDGVVSVSNPAEGLEVFYNGRFVEVVAPQLLRARACGLCGDLNGENTADLKAPEECIMSSPRLAAFSYLWEEDQCPGIPSEYREQFNKDKNQCSKKHSISTPLRRLAKNLMRGQLKQRLVSHKYEVQMNQICISKKPIRTCPENWTPVAKRPTELQYTCLTRTSSVAQQIFQRVKDGEVISEIRQLPTVFTKKAYEPTDCKRNFYSEQDQQQMRIEEDEQQYDFEGQQGQQQQRQQQQRQQHQRQQQQRQQEQREQQQRQRQHRHEEQYRKQQQKLREQEGDQEWQPSSWELEDYEDERTVFGARQQGRSRGHRQQQPSIF